MAEKEITISYSFFEFESTGEIHIYQGEFTSECGCVIKNIPICKGNFRTNNNSNIIKLCLKIDIAKKIAISIGEIICEDCLLGLS